MTKIYANCKLLSNLAAGYNILKVLEKPIQLFIWISISFSLGINTIADGLERPKAKDTLTKAICPTCRRKSFGWVNKVK